MVVQSVTDFSEFMDIISSEKPVIFDFWAEWCGPCKAISPIFEQLAQIEESSGVGFYKVDVDAAEQIAQEVGVRAMPTFVVFMNGEKVSELVGAQPPKLEALVKEVASLA